MQNKLNTVFSNLQEIFPPILLLIVYIPLLIGLFIDSVLFDIRYLIINLVWIPFFTIPFIVSKKRISYYFAVVLYFIIGLIEIGHWIIIKGPLTLTSLLVISSTNLQEAVEFFDLKATLWLLVLIPYTYLFYMALKHTPKIVNSKNKLHVICGVIAFSVFFIGETVIHGRFIRKGTPQIIKVTYSFITQRNLFFEAMQVQAPRNIEARSTKDLGNQTFVLIIGESCNRNHMSLYGAERKTNPELEKRDDLLIFTNVVSPYSNTLNSVLSMFSNSSLDQKISFEESIDLIDVFHSSGFKTYWISNQSPIGVWDNLVTVLAKKSDYSKFVNTTGSTSFESILTRSYDSKLFTPFLHVLQEDVQKKFIVLHLMGSHAAYSKRYPAEYEIFKGNGKKVNTIAEYDNSILYTDFIIDSLLNILTSQTNSKTNQISLALYISDHGENVYDEFDRVGHDFSNELPGANVEVPFIVWLSRTYLKRNSEKFKTIISNVNKPYVSDDLFHSIIDLNDIQSPYLIEERSLFGANYNDKRLRILEDGKDYDLKPNIP